MYIRTDEPLVEHSNVGEINLGKKGSD